MKINIVSPGRFHVLDLARELDKQGFDVKFYSFVPCFQAKKYGLPEHCSMSLFYLLLPFLCLGKIFKNRDWTIQLRIWIQDRLTSIVMRKCDVLIAMSGDFVVTPRNAKRKGATVIIERGSKHILEQRKILESVPSLAGTKPVPDANVKRELECYEIADYVSIASEHVKRSFLKYGYNESKLFINPYGVDLSMFKPLSIEKKYDLIFVGNWSYQKGCDLILDAVRTLKIQFLHVGSIIDVPFVEDEYCHHHDSVNQSELVNYYNQSKIFIIPSRQEGLAMVQAQAIACQLPIIGSPDSGAEDLKKLVEKSEFINIISDYSIEALCTSIQNSLNNYKEVDYAGSALSQLTWEAYGHRYASFLNTL